MMYSTIALFILSFLSVVFADQNTTIDDTNASIQYSDGGHSLPCIIDSNGQFQSSQPGCFYNGQNNCSSGAHVLQTQTSTVSMQFRGSAIFMNALLDDISNIYTVTLDGKSTDVDGVRPGGALLCYTLFSQAGLDPTVMHNISLSIKGLSPNRNTTLDNDDTFSFWLDNFVVTTPDTGTNSSSSSANSVSSSSGTSATIASSSNPSPSPTGTSGALRQNAAIFPLFSFGIGVVAVSILSL